MGGKHSVQTNLPVPTMFNIANSACVSLDDSIDHVLVTTYQICLLIIIQLDQILLDCMLQSKFCIVMNGILANAPDPANTSVMVDGGQLISRWIFG